jgi:glutathione S-transferase
MITLYYARPSIYSRPVWLTLLEKNLDFELVTVQLNGKQFEPEFREINPFSHIPVLVDDNFRVIESAAILDYLEAKYPNPSFLPTDAVTLAKVKMVQMVVTNELVPATAGLIIHQDNLSELEYAQLRAINVLNFLTDFLEDNLYFGGKDLTIADIVAGTIIPDLPRLGIDLVNYPQLSNWCERLLSRKSWQQIQLSDAEFQNFQRQFKVLPKIWQKRRRQRKVILTKQND